MGMHGPPFPWRCALPLVKRAKKRVRVFVPALQSAGTNYLSLIQTSNDFEIPTVR